MASLFSEIQNDILKPEANITDILRKCLVLAYKINNEDFIKWTELELNGYDDSDILPEYRIIGTVIRGDFSNGRGANAPNMPIEKRLLPKNLGHNFGEGKIYYSASYLEGILLYIADDDPRRDLPMEILRSFNGLYSGLFCMRAYEITPRTGFYNIVDSIKNKILKFLLEIESKIDDIEDIKLSKEDEKIVTQTFNNHIYGNANVANASENFSQSLQIQSNELIDKLIFELTQIKNQGIDTDVIDKVIPNLESMKGIKDKSIIMGKLVDIMTIAGGAASVSSAIMPYIEPIKKLFM
ncbi:MULTISPECIES: hypothetical protein [Providencia]|uniref:AbiTii domain-containing protein n=1 Tax=Providencia TaxID=586 RepID=UPI001419CE95|nr:MULTISPECIES: hypothetical protein [Providencia]ELR5146294.1 hypothetical protein [Providencia rettgeri]NIA45891.1 hypothetical protein [Providencia rettgeri]NIA99452.1 hypothetical protein [Providencia rettgeri]NIB17104.1 hypothetical protein [Providencia rettgeri]NIB37333.1 hypothetical protein [Providencia rettgeri]